MNTNPFQGDPLLTLGPDGSTLHFVGGQPVMDQGLENLAAMSVLTEADWPGNTLIQDTDKQFNGGRFLRASRKPTTLLTLTEMEQGIVADMANPAFGKVTAVVTNPTSNDIVARILIQPPGQTARQVILTRSGLNWTAQALNPAHEKI